MKKPSGTAVTADESNVGRILVENLRRETCMQCGSQSLKLFFAMEQEVRPPEYSHAVIAMCSDCGKGQLERTYHDSANGEDSFDQTEWYLLDKDSMERLREFIQQRKKDGTSRGKFSPCPEPLSPKCLCGIHWQLTEAARRLEPLTDDEMREFGSGIVSTVSLNNAGIPRFERAC